MGWEVSSMTQQARAEKLVGSANVSLGFVENGLMFNLNLGDPGQANINLPGYGAGFHLPYYGGGPQGGIGFNSISDLGRMFRGFVSDVKSMFSSVGNFFGNIFGGIGDFFSSIFPVALDLNGDGYQHLTAWAAPGDALLAYDANNDGKIDQQNEIDFTQWDPTATSDMQALRDVFDTNHGGKLSASDANFSQFKLIVTNADGTQTLQTLAQAGIASIDLIEDQTTRTFADGSGHAPQTITTTHAQASLDHDLHRARRDRRERQPRLNAMRAGRHRPEHGLARLRRSERFAVDRPDDLRIGA
jgi:hypothetical protein